VYDPTIDAIAVTNLNDFLAITLPLVGLAIYIGANLFQYSRRRSRNLTVQPLGQFLVQMGIVAAVVVGIMVLFASVPNGGTPLAFVLTLVLVAVAWLILTKTAFGRHVYAVGGNLEAARRAGVRVAGLKIAMFSSASCLAAVAGIYGVSRTLTAFTQLDQSLLLYSIAAAVIGGVSLFGGRGSVWAVIPGALVVYTLVNGLALLNEPAAVVYIVQGAVLLLAVLVDALLRRRSQTGYR
jgi:D-xylose transport system permease protein